MRVPSLLCLLALAGCAPSGSLSSVSAPTRIVQSGGGYDIVLEGNTTAAESVVPAPPERAWPALMEVYAELGVPVATADPGERLLGNQRYLVRRRLAGQSLSAYLECGTNLTGSIANQYQVQLAVLSKLDPARDGATRVQTRVDARARTTDGSSMDWVACGTTGRLEGRIAEMLEARLRG